MRRQGVDLSELARGVVAALRKAEPERDVECAIADSVIVNGDPQLLRIALENVLGNAWKYTRKHARARIELGVALQPDGRRAIFVRDDGAGFDMKYAEKLFTPFKRLHDAADFAGTGIGLATVHRIVSRHGGRIWAEGEVERGCTLYIVL
jgi:signal transduction histidine kinase